MHAVTLTAEGTILEEGRPAGHDPLVYLSYRIELEAGYTLRSFFRLFARYGDLARLSPFLADSMKRYRESPESGCVYPGFDRLELSKTVEMIGFPGDPRLEIYMSFQGVSGEEVEELKFVPLESLLDMPVSLGLLKHIIFGDKVDLFEFETVYTLFEFIDGILWELSFHGTPARCEIRR